MTEAGRNRTVRSFIHGERETIETESWYDRDAFADAPWPGRGLCAHGQTVKGQ
jgi:hypothetical protein